MTKKKSTAAAEVLGRLGGLVGGKASTPAKRRAAKANGKKGGRPRKTAATILQEMTTKLGYLPKSSHLP